jgi:hypothetical protein
LHIQRREIERRKEVGNNQEKGATKEGCNDMKQKQYESNGQKEEEDPVHMAGNEIVL